MGKTAKEVTINYLENIKKEYENAFLEWINSDINDRTKLLSITLAVEISILNHVIEIFKRNEGE